MINAGKKKAMEKFLFNALTVDLQKINKKLKVGKTKFVVTFLKMAKSDYNTDAESVTFVAGTTRTRFG